MMYFLFHSTNFFKKFLSIVVDTTKQYLACFIDEDSSLQGPSRLQLSKPLIAAVSGFAVAGGLELALLADLRVVEESAIMGVFCRRFGTSQQHRANLFRCLGQNCNLLCRSGR